MRTHEDLVCCQQYMAIELAAGHLHQHGQFRAVSQGRSHVQH